MEKTYKKILIKNAWQRSETLKMAVPPLPPKSQSVEMRNILANHIVALTHAHGRCCCAAGMALSHSERGFKLTSQI